MSDGKIRNLKDLNTIMQQQKLVEFIERFAELEKIIVSSSHFSPL